MTENIFGKDKTYSETVAELASLSKKEALKHFEPYLRKDDLSEETRKRVNEETRAVFEKRIELVTKELDEQRRELNVIRERLRIAWTQCECSANSIMQLRQTLKLS